MAPGRARGNAWHRVRNAIRRSSVAIDRLIFVYGTDLLAVVESRGARHPQGDAACALRAITHTGFDERNEWSSIRRRLLVTVHCLEPSAAAQKLPGVAIPCVLVQTPSGYEHLLDAAAIEGCAGSAKALREELLRSARLHGFRLE